MTQAATNPNPGAKAQFDPEDFRMTIGEHLEDLRRRIIWGLVAVFIAVVGCMLLGERVVVFFCRPMVDALKSANVNPQLVVNQVSGAFFTYLKVSLLCGFAIAGPFAIYQIWQFVAVGLYPNERKAVTRYVPMSIILFMIGVVFVYYLVIPLTLNFLIHFGNGLAPTIAHQVDAAHPDFKFPTVPSLDGDPPDPAEGQIWIDTHAGQMKVFHNGAMRVIALGNDQLTTPQFTINDYIDLVLVSMLIFGLCFQLPLVVMAAGRIGIVDVPGLRKMRRLVYFIMSIVAAVMAPGDVVTSMVALLAPLILLYEFGIFMVWWGQRKEKKAEEAAARAD